MCDFRRSVGRVGEGHKQYPLIWCVEIEVIYNLYQVVIPKICRSASSLTTMEADLVITPYPGCVS